MMRKVTTSLMASLFCLSIFAAGNLNTTQIGRYETVSNGPTESQVDPLNQTFQIQFPSDVTTIKGALDYILANTSYQLQPSKYWTPNMKALMELSLPLSVRKLGPITVKQALHTLSGKSYQLLIDPRNRWIAFQLSPFARNLFSH